MNLFKIKKGFSKVTGVSISVDGHFVELAMDADKAPLGTALRDFLYSFLTAYENDYFIKIKGMPYCFLPEAQDHVCYERVLSKKYMRFHFCRVCRHFENCPGITKAMKPIAAIVKPVFDAPSDISIEVNSRCNLSCRHCVKKAAPGSGSPSLGRIRDVLDQAKECGVRTVRFTGGEPLLRKDIFKILALAKDRGFTVFLNTNGTLLTREIISKLEKYVDNVLVSLCGYNETTENLLNSKGKFLTRKLSHILWLRRSKIPHVRLGTVISKLLLARFDRYARLIKSSGVNSWELYRPMITASANRLYNLQKKDYRRLLGHLKDFRRLGMMVYIANAFPFCFADISAGTVLRGAQFDDGNGRIVLDARGYFKPSYFIDRDLGRDLMVAWRHPFARGLRSYSQLTVPCRHCRARRWCLGGSRFLAHAVTGDYMAPDPLVKFSGRL